MIAREIIRDVSTDGIVLAVSPDGGLSFTGEQEAVERWLPTLRRHRAEIVNHLNQTGGSSARSLPEWCRVDCERFQQMDLGTGTAWCISVLDAQNWTLRRIDRMIGCPLEEQHDREQL